MKMISRIHNSQIPNFPKTINKLSTFFFKISHFSKPKDNSKGEDAYSFTPQMLCVADGVGGWVYHGVDSSIYSKALVENYTKIFKKYPSYKNIDIFSKACKLTENILGSSTFCSCILKDHKLDTLNLGDSGYMIIRKNKIYYKSKEQQHSFNFPFQVGTNTDTPDKADLHTHEVNHNDIIVLATDGLWDNLYDEKILDMVVNNKDARDIGNECYQKSKKKYYISPFSLHSNFKYLGGKPDDITIILALINQNIKH